MWLWRSLKPYADGREAHVPMYRKERPCRRAASLGYQCRSGGRKELEQVRLAPEIDDMMRFIADYIGDETQGKGLWIDYTDGGDRLRIC